MEGGSSDQMKVLVLGGSGFIGQAFLKELDRRGIDYESLARSYYDYTKFDLLLAYLKTVKPSFVINVAGYAGRPNVDTCEVEKAETLIGNLVLAVKISNACAALNIPWGHVSSGCIYNEGKFSERDTPNFSFRSPPVSFYSGTKALAEEVIVGGNCYIWRVRLPFDEFDGPRNYLSKLQRYERVYSNTNSLSHRGDFAKACLDLWEIQAPFGIYNLTNPGYVSTEYVVDRIKAVLKIDREFNYWENDDEFYRHVVAPRSNCILDTSKVKAAGVVVRPVEDAIEDALNKWVKE